MLKQFSPNMLKTYEQCSKKFMFKYIKNISMPVREEIFEFGKNIHAIASYYLRNENIDKFEKELSSKEKDVWDFLKKTKYFSYDVINTEYNLLVRLDDYFFGGRLDALVKNNESYYILDYKTGSVPKNPVYDYQTMIYILAVKEFFKTENVTFVYLDLKQKKELEIILTDELTQNYKKKLIETAKKINSSEFYPKQNKCSCEYEKICYNYTSQK